MIMPAALIFLYFATKRGFRPCRRPLFEALGMPPRLFASFHLLLRHSQARPEGNSSPLSTLFIGIPSPRASPARLVLTSFRSLAPSREPHEFSRLSASPAGVSQALFQALSGCRDGRLAIDRANKELADAERSDTRFSFSGGLLLPRDPKAVVEMKRVTFIPVHILMPPWEL
jgi:hypothetical protein